jgi:hypothetical protein
MHPWTPTSKSPPSIHGRLLGRAAHGDAAGRSQQKVAHLTQRPSKRLCTARLRPVKDHEDEAHVVMLAPRFARGPSQMLAQRTVLARERPPFSLSRGLRSHTPASGRARRNRARSAGSGRRESRRAARSPSAAPSMAAGARNLVRQGPHGTGVLVAFPPKRDIRGLRSPAEGCKRGKDGRDSAFRRLGISAFRFLGGEIVRIRFRSAERSFLHVKRGGSAVAC